MSTLPSKLAIGLVLLSAVLMATLYTVHKTPSFQTNFPNWMMDTPPGMEIDRSTDMKNPNRREMREQPVVEAVEEEEEEENRKPMNIILFYADDWRHDVS